MSLFSLKKFWARMTRRRWRDDRKAILEFNRSLALIADPNTLTASIAARLKEMFGTDRSILLSATDVGMFTVAFNSGYSPDELVNVRLSHQDRLAKWLLTNEIPLIVNANANVVNYLSEVEREMLKRLDVRVCVPLLALNRLTAIMLLSTTDREVSLSQDDLTLLQMLMNQASIAFENAYLYQQQRDRLRRLHRAERLAAAGELAASVAHEVRNPLTSIRSTVQYLLGDFDESNPKRELIEGLIAEVDRIDRTVDGLLSLTRSAEFRPERIALGRLIQEALLLVRRQGHNQQVEIRCLIEEPDLYIMGDESQLKQLFLNVVLNSLQEMQDGGRVDVELSTAPDSVGLASERNWVYVKITDSGHGIPAENLDKIFDPFFTTKQGGTGLGLFTSYTIARHHGGELEVSSQVGVGTTVGVRFPLVK